MNRKHLLNLANKFQGIPYIWGGSNPHIGFDCSGFVIWCLQVFEILPAGDWTADALSKLFKKTTTPKPGDLCCYGTSKKVTHITVFRGGDEMIGANGGDSTCVDEASAKLKNAMVKVKPVKYRSDFLFYVDIEAML